MELVSNVNYVYWRVYHRQLIIIFSSRKPGFNPGQSVWDLRWTKWHLGTIFSEHFPLPIIIPNVPFCHLSFRASTIGSFASVVTREMPSPHPKKKRTNLHIFQSCFTCVWLNVITESMAYAFVSSSMFAEVNTVRDNRIAWGEQRAFCLRTVDSSKASDKTAPALPVLRILCFKRYSDLFGLYE
jgi:hypothetical protein